MFHDWKVGKQGWVRLRNWKVARATNHGHGEYPVMIQYLKGKHLDYSFLHVNGSFHKKSESDVDAIEHLPDCTGFDWEPKPHQWKVGDWFVVDQAHHGDDLWVVGMEIYLRIPQRVVCIHAGDLKSTNDLWWDKSWCRPCDPPHKFKVGDWVRIISHEGWCKASTIVCIEGFQRESTKHGHR